MTEDDQKYDDYVERKLGEGKEPQPREKWQVDFDRMAAARAAKQPKVLPSPDLEPLGPVPDGFPFAGMTVENDPPREEDPEDSAPIAPTAIYAPAPDAEAAALRAELDAIKNQLAALAPKDEAPAPPPRPRVWGEDGIYSYFSHFKEHQLTMVAGRTMMSPDGRAVTKDHRTIDFSDNLFTTSDPEVKDYIESHPEYGRDFFRTTTMTAPAVQVTDGPRTGNVQTRTASYDDRPTPLHANV